MPIGWDVYDKPHDQASKNDYFSAMIQTAKARSFAAVCVVFDSWHSSCLIPGGDIECWTSSDLEMDKLRRA